MQTRLVFVSAFVGALVAACEQDRPAPPTTSAPAPSPPAVEEELEPTALGMFAPLPKEMPSPTNVVTEAKVTLGRMLYFEKRISKNHDISCNSCHDLQKFGVDGQAFSDGHRGQQGSRNAPTVYNAAGHMAQFWDGRAPDVEKQAQGPVLNPVEMAMPNAQKVLAVLESMPEYVAAFEKAFPEDREPLSYDNFGKAIGAFERRLVTLDRWDKYLEGETSALTAAEKKGLSLFINTGCPACHNGPYMGGSAFQKLGAMKPWPNQKDLGRFDVTKQEADKLSFKVPSLRNIAETAPYFHDASVNTLLGAVSSMAEHQLGKQLAKEDVASIVAFLKALTGELPAEYIKEPVLPKSTARTPKPDPS